MKKMFRQFTCIDRWDDNEQYFDPLLDKIKSGNAIEVVEDMKTWSESDIEPYTYEDVIKGMANNDAETKVYEDDMYILTASEVTITLFQRV